MAFWVLFGKHLLGEFYEFMWVGKNSESIHFEVGNCLTFGKKGFTFGLL